MTFALSIGLLLVDRIPMIRFGILGIAVALYIVFGPKGSDHTAYEELFRSNCEGIVFRGFEPFYQFSSYVFGSIFGCDTLDFFIIAYIWIAILALVFVLPTGNSRVRFYFISTVILYLVTFQYAFNFRTVYLQVF